MTVALEDIWTQFATRLRFFIRGRVADDATADDILQTVFMKIQQRMTTLRGSEKLKAWVYQITRNAIVDHYRGARPTEELPDDLSLPEEIGQEFEKGPLLAAFRRMINALPEPYREAIKLTEFQGLTQEKLATRLGISLSGAKSRVQRGRAQLKEMLLDCCRLEFDRRGGVLGCEPRRAEACEECCSD